MNAAIKADVERREISRLCHLTPLRNLVHIATGDGLLSTKFLSESERREFNQQDLERLDEHPDHICCSIEYPNMWYLRQRKRDARGSATLFPDWVCLCLDPRSIWADSTLFCPRNAAAARGRLVLGGLDAFVVLFADEVEGARGATYKRGKSRAPSSPTDDQAEVLVHRTIPLNDVQQIVVADESQAKRTFVALTQLGVPENLFEWAICSEFFQPTTLSAMIARGQRPTEYVWDPRSLVGV
jgi:hypothetical protein